MGRGQLRLEFSISNSHLSLVGVGVDYLLSIFEKRMLAVEQCLDELICIFIWTKCAFSNGTKAFSKKQKNNIYNWDK
ncbi:hypothetical protein T07_15304 [Trichinella nelsoni]|uniref:Uncharacterized protein n=1 Tax=Trichinella nelsoni TaxID=6336 RepID=A0A0V0S9X8_9BILA|nr:hypothetical protein T07_15304 [Trichinella nelsoni]